MEQHMLATLVRDRHQELRRMAAGVAAGRRAGEVARTGEHRPLALRLMGRVLGPR